MALLSQTQETSCGWEAGRWVCRTPAPVTQVQPYEGMRRFRESYETMAMIDRDRRERAAREAPATEGYNPPAVVYSAPTTDDVAALPRAPVTPNDLYVGCYLLVRDSSAAEDAAGRPANFSPEMCGLAAMLAMRDREGPRPDQDQTTIFCLPATSDVSSNPGLAMANAYLDFYDQRSPQNHTQDGMLAFTAAMIDKWPCEA